MKTNIEILKEKRQVVISLLKEAFYFKIYDLKDVMTRLVVYIKQEEGDGLDLNDDPNNFTLKNVIRYFKYEIEDTLESDFYKKEDFKERQRNIALISAGLN